MTEEPILFITRHDPSQSGGGCYATRAYLEALIELYPQRVCLFVGSSFNEYKIHGYENLREIIRIPGRSLLQFARGMIKNSYTKFEDALEKWLKNNRPEFAILDGGIIGGSYVKCLKGCQAKVYTIHHNQEVEYNRDNKTMDTLRGKYMGWVKAVEKKAYLLSDKNLFITNADLQAFEMVYGSSEGNYTLGCFEFFSETPVKHKVSISENLERDLKLVVSGSLEAIQSTEGIYWFINNIYTKLKTKAPHMKLTLTGRNPGDELIALCKEKEIDIIPSPDDILLILSQNHIYLCPVKLGGGLKLRIMDAMKVGLPCLIQERSLRGYEEMTKTGFVSSFKDENDFIKQFEKLLEKMKSNSSFSEIIISEYQKHFSFASGILKLKSIIENGLA
ncbi:glycosyltransferase [Flavobacterium piscis]|uniref:Glycosyltransferase involved in cell wall biosynthesis n=1 Tax=Flavobacterium piscis TaxID=1114874 RepID=A0ABU1Y8W6_9FLAO|nr:glycosyltransferase [Flavobacterium piscis]MDR7210675.1 glycosyltransferase involved in cell wall biosynthesis [Flavobacterium piscis]